MAGALTVSLLLCGSAVGASGSADRRPVLVELFTSEGCSDCPPADALLARLDREQFVEGAEAIVLSEHVTYWNRLGWTDPFSLEQASERQARYGERFHLDSVYTPQVVVDGALQVVGNSEAGVAGAVKRAAAEAKEPLSIALEGWPGESLRLKVKSAARGDLYIALAEDATRSIVVRGENAGRTLHHVAVAREITEFGSGMTDGRTLTVKTSGLVRGSGAEGPARLVRVIAFVTEGPNGRVVAAGEQSIEYR